jgi:hypothetical protein
MFSGTVMVEVKVNTGCSGRGSGKVKVGQQ